MLATEGEGQLAPRCLPTLSPPRAQALELTMTVTPRHGRAQLGAAATCYWASLLDGQACSS